MKNILIIFLSCLVIIACDNKQEVGSVNPEQWDKRAVGYKLGDSLSTGETYLAVYSQIYGMTDQRTHDLTATISMRNTNRYDSVFIIKSEYFNTKGDLIRSYFDKPIYLGPMETVEIIINKIDREGGTGGNFMFEWKTKHTSNEPLFECVMISTSGQQGISFTTQGIKLK